ncbi:hypothetical protein [Corynebacterium anserum]|uniref:Uncharacterized protein n=1 Tax=Corynebacterium anserum TaxID=2684406 RepID=A0A7G7YN16_9CORY|nr:hypothetical protein [Corynebacterium anserum]MBC2680879.1 hypothetical protein [Corynebacterium anserum]QNH95886.1 hypothetical protein GP473_03615 [Corynebacterium anserum]
MKTRVRSRLQSLPQGVADAALFFVVTVVVFTVAGALWGALYPTTQVRISADAGAEIVPETVDAGFQAYAWYIVGSVVLGFALARWAYTTLRRGVTQLLWLFCWVLFGAWWAILIGARVVEAVHPMDRSVTQPGDVFYVVDFISAWPVVLVAPTIAVLSYWIGAVVDDPDSFEN